MSTRSFIAVKDSELISAVYCHFDGYPSNNGVLLNRFYGCFAKAAELISMGSLSSLSVDIEKTVFHHRDDGQDLEIMRFRSEKELVNRAKNTYVDYVYFFNKEISNDEWLLWDNRNQVFRFMTSSDFKQI